MRLSIEITPEQHQCLKAAAALQGKTIKAYVLERALADMSDPGDTDLKALEALLKSRIEAAERGAVSGQSVADIVNETLRETDRR
ncbi:MAG: DUF1778 domain-containing protein [Gammaproteobacteria bacterium]